MYHRSPLSHMRPSRLGSLHGRSRMNLMMQDIGIGRTGTQTPSSTASSSCSALLINRLAVSVWPPMNSFLHPSSFGKTPDGQGQTGSCCEVTAIHCASRLPAKESVVLRPLERGLNPSPHPRPSDIFKAVNQQDTPAASTPRSCEVVAGDNIDRSLERTYLGPLSSLAHLLSGRYTCGGG